MTAPQRKHSPTTQGERELHKLLTTMGIKFQTEVALPQQLHLFYDVGIQDEQGTIVAMVEVNGPCHYESKLMFDGSGAPFDHSPHDLHMVQVRDAQKKSYCEQRGIPLLVIDLRESKNGLLTMNQIFSIKRFVRGVL